MQVLLGKTGRDGLKRRIQQCNINDVKTAAANRAKQLLGAVDLEMIRDVSAGAATFFVWVSMYAEKLIF